MARVPFQEGAFQNNVFQTLDNTAVYAAFQNNAFFGMAFGNIDNTPRYDAFQNNAFQDNAFQVLGPALSQSFNAAFAGASWTAP